MRVEQSTRTYIARSKPADASELQSYSREHGIDLVVDTRRDVVRFPAIVFKTDLEEVCYIPEKRREENLVA